MEKLTVNELFSGIGAQRKAFERLGIPHEVVGISEIDKYAIQSYEAIFGATRNYGDICTAPRLDYADLWTYSFPCQDISVAGNQKGISADTRSGLLYQVQRLLEVAKEEGTLPKYLLLENVKNLVGKKFKSQFDNWLFYLDQLGYDTYWQVLNAKNYGIPQNRERVFAVSIRKDLNETFEFPKAEVLTKRLADILEDEVDEKFYLSQDKVDSFINNSLNNIPFFQFDKDGVVKVREAVKKGYSEATIGDSINIAYLNSKLRRGRVGRGVAQTLTTEPQQVVVQPAIISKQGTFLEKKTDVACTLMARDYKGFGNQGMNGVIEVPCADYKKAKIVCEQRCDEGLRFFKDYAIGTLRTIDACGDKRVIEFPCIGASRGRNPENPTDRTAGVPTQQRLELNFEGVSNTLTTVQKDNYVVEDRIVQVGNIVNTGNWKNPQRGRIYSTEGLSPALNTVGGGGLEPKIVEGIRIRKLTPLECWRLMGFDDDDFHKAQQSGVSNSQLYKQAGNAIVVDVLEKIFKNLYREEE